MREDSKRCQTNHLKASWYLFTRKRRRTWKTWHTNLVGSYHHIDSNGPVETAPTDWLDIIIGQIRSKCTGNIMCRFTIMCNTLYKFKLLHSLYSHFVTRKINHFTVKMCLRRSGILLISSWKLLLDHLLVSQYSHFHRVAWPINFILTITSGKRGYRPGSFGPLVPVSKPGPIRRD
jgi:hypothetical protein